MTSKIMLLMLMSFISIRQIDAQIMQSTIVKPVEKVDVIPKAPTLTLPIAKVPEIVVAVDSVHRVSPAAQYYYFHFTATFKNLPNHTPGYRWMIERYNHPAEVLGQYAFNPSTPNLGKIMLGRDSTVSGSIKLWCELVQSIPLSSNKVEY